MVLSCLDRTACYSSLQCLRDGGGALGVPVWVKVHGPPVISGLDFVLVRHEVLHPQSRQFLQHLCEVRKRSYILTFHYNNSYRAEALW